MVKNDTSFFPYDTDEIACQTDVVPQVTEVSRPGLAISALRPGERVAFRTRNSMYRIVVLSPAQQTVIIRGGSHFPRPIEATLVGTTDGVRRQSNWVSIGQRLEVAVGHRLFLTSLLTEIEREPEKTAEHS